MPGPRIPGATFRLVPPTLAVTEPSPQEPEPDHDRHQTLVELVSRGEQPALNDLLAEHVPAIEAFVRRRGQMLPGARESMSDVVQSVCREALEDLGDNFEYQGRGQFVSWLHKLALSKLIQKQRYHLAAKRDANRDQHGAGVNTQGDPVTLGDVAATFCTPTKMAVAHEEQERLARAFDKLPEEYQQVIYLARVQGLPHKEIGQQIGMTPEASRQLLARAIARLALVMGT